MLTSRFGTKQVNISEQSIGAAGQFVGWLGWVANRPFLFITHGQGRPLESKTAAVNREQLIDFTTPGSLGALYTGDRPLDPRVCALRCIEVAKALGVEPDEFRLSQILDLVESCIDVLHRTPTYDLIQKGGARGEDAIGDITLKINGETVHQAEVRV